MTEEKAQNDKDEKKKTSNALRKAVIGLVGTLLTVCGGVSGALLSAGVTIYQIERERQQVALAAPSAEQALTVDTRQIAIDQDAAVGLDPKEYRIDQGAGFVVAQPRAGWRSEDLVYGDLFMDQGSLSPLVLFYSAVGLTWNEQPLYRMRYEEPIQVQFQEGSKENGIVVDVESLRQLAGTDTLSNYSQIIVLAVDKGVAADYTLADIALGWGRSHLGGVNHIVANREGEYILMQATWRLEDVRVDGQETDLAIERWALFAEGSAHYYAVELNYVSWPSQPLQVWEDLQAYMDSFRVIH
jgi:hypothetical protein